MMKRPRLSRPFCVSMLALAGLLVFSYFPLSRIRAANAGATILPSAGKPLVNLKSSLTPAITYTGSAEAVAALKGGTATPTALAAADFNADGAMDVVAGYSTKNGGALALFHGNPDAFAPSDLTLYGKAAQGKVPPTFLPKASAFTLPESADLLATGDFNRDGKKDVLVAARGSSNLYLLAGDGTGNLLAPQAVPLPGQIRALAVTPDGHVAVSLEGPSASQLAILAPGKEGFTTVATYPLPARGDSVAWGSTGRRSRRGRRRGLERSDGLQCAHCQRADRNRHRSVPGTGSGIRRFHLGPRRPHRDFCSRRRWLHPHSAAWNAEYSAADGGGASRPPSCDQRTSHAIGDCAESDCSGRVDGCQATALRRIGSFGTGLGFGF